MSGEDITSFFTTQSLNADGRELETDMLRQRAQQAPTIKDRINTDNV